ncbi:FAD-dependent oxidoreductase [Anaeroselena agilis]|uniref:FAD-dependent oxidoreductase n=1 Tax=Anaeroselena agilis TaxID=3063788 RepID=A0ABU3NXF4_9FIRM|nr:FAD-dependent oxidoreductase [Selenomonadales bacterium 4137-cl]
MLNEWFKTKKPHKLPPRTQAASTAAAPRKYDAIVVGAGPSGASAACFMARDGLDVLLLERGPFPGAKTCGGAAVIAEQIHELFPNFWEECRYERIVTRLDYWWLNDDSAVTAGFTSGRLAAAPYNRLSVKRKNFYSWLAAKAVSAGATLLLGHTVDDVLLDHGRTVGVHVSPPQNTTFLADIVILADGANSLLAERAGLNSSVTAKNLSLYAKETIALPPETIEERFNLPPGQGAAIGLIGYPTAGFNGTGSIHLFRDGVNINAGMSVSDFAAGGFGPGDLLERIKKHPRIQPLLAGGVTAEYGAAMIPEGGYHAIPPLVHPGLLIAGDAASLVNGTQGINLAMWSGFYAAKAAFEAKKSRDFSARKLSLYRTLLDESFILQNMRANAKAAALQRDRPYLFDLYSRMANEAAYQMARAYPMPMNAKRKFIWHKVTSLQPVGKIAADLWQVLKVVKG